MTKELYEKLVKPNVIELDNKINKIDVSKVEGQIEEYDYQKELYNILTEKFNIIENIALEHVNKNVKEFEEKEDLRNNAEVRIVQYDKLQNQVKNSYSKIAKSLESGKNIKIELDNLDCVGIGIYKNTTDIEQINKNVEIHKQEYNSNLPDVPKSFFKKVSEYFSKERREYIKVLNDYKKMIKIHANEGNKLVKKQFDIEKNLLNFINNSKNVEEKEFIDALKLDELTIKIMNNNKEGNTNEKYIADSIGLIFKGILKQEIEKCILSDSQINDKDKNINYNNVFEKIQFAENDISYDIGKIDELMINKSNLEIKEDINSLIEKSHKTLEDSNKIMANSINQILELLNDIPKDKKNDYEQFVVKMCGKYPHFIQK